MGRRDGSKPTFAELDKRRREGTERAPKSHPREAQAQRSYRAALERAFAEGKVDELAASLSRARDLSPPIPPPTPSTPDPTPPTPATTTIRSDPARAERQTLLAAIRSAETPDATHKALDRYISRFTDLPPDLEV
ncbi:MAG TPA: hypothetical protein VL172_14860, partial [Kofleriaceae bacterium]|nr:hypothetical protein [Kofleriaceae bacterium]